MEADQEDKEPVIAWVSVRERHQQGAGPLQGAL